MKRLVPVVLVIASCATPPRFLDQPVVTRVDDTRDIERPASNDFYRIRYMADAFALRALTRQMELRTTRPAQSTNALDDVPDSTWFQGRIGQHPVTPEEAAIGPGTSGPPKLPFTVIAGKSGGGNPGFIAKDRDGRGFLVKFDPKNNPEMQTATDVIVSRLFWVMGWNTPADFVIDFSRDDLRIGEGATDKDELGRKEPLTFEHIDDALATSPRRPDGRYRALASELVPGKVLGGITPEGTREDDKNDTIPHEHRRELRGLLAPAAWLNHTDMKEDNLLDTWVEEDGRHFVRHYMVDFGEALAAHAAEKGRRQDGYEYFVDWSALSAGLLSFGLWIREWEAVTETPYRAIGSFAAQPFDPNTFKEAYPFAPFIEADAADRYWGAKLVMRIDRPLIEAIVAEARLSNPKAAAYLVDVLMERRDAVGRAFFAEVSTLDEFTVEGSRICGVDMAQRFGLADHGVIEVLPEHTDDPPDQESTAERDGRFCFDRRGDGYTIYRLRVRRGGERHPVMQLHVQNDAEPRVLGLVRIEPAE